MPKPDPASTPRKPRLLVLLGRQRTGKTLFAQWYAETTTRDLPLRILDADQGEQVLSDRIDEAVASPRADDDRRAWLEAEIERQVNAVASEPYDVLLDPGGSDPQMKRWGVQLDMVDMLQSAGVDVVAIHLLGPDVADLSYMRDIEDGNLFCPVRTIVLFNKALVSAGQTAHSAFAEVVKSEPVKRIMKRDGRVLGKDDKPLSIEPLRDMPLIEANKMKLLDVVNRKGAAPLFVVARTRTWLNGPMAALRAELGDWIG